MTRDDVNGCSPDVHVVDDDDSICSALELLLRAAGFHAVTFGSAEEFLAADSSATCLILDVRLPGMSGLDLLERLTDSGRDVRAVLITAHSNEQDRGRAFADGALDYLEKPFDVEKLLAAVRRAIGE